MAKVKNEGAGPDRNIEAPSAILSVMVGFRLYKAPPLCDLFSHEILFYVLSFFFCNYPCKPYHDRLLVEMRVTEGLPPSLKVVVMVFVVVTPAT